MYGKIYPDVELTYYDDKSKQYVKRYFLDEDDARTKSIPIMLDAIQRCPTTMEAFMQELYDSSKKEFEMCKWGYEGDFFDLLKPVYEKITEKKIEIKYLDECEDDEDDEDDEDEYSVVVCDLNPWRRYYDL